MTIKEKINEFLRKLNYTEEEFNLFETGVDNSNKLEYIEQTEEIEEDNTLTDTDYVS